mgnify:CR=1 FL=1
MPNLSHYEIKSSGPILDDFSKADIYQSDQVWYTNCGKGLQKVKRLSDRTFGPNSSELTFNKIESIFYEYASHHQATSSETLYRNTH